MTRPLESDWDQGGQVSAWESFSCYHEKTKTLSSFYSVILCVDMLGEDDAAEDAITVTCALGLQQSILHSIVMKAIRRARVAGALTLSDLILVSMNLGSL